MHHTGMHGAAAGERTGARPSDALMSGKIWVIFFKSMRKYKSLNSRASFEALQKKHEVSPQLYIFLGAEFLELMMFGNTELEKWERSNPK